MPLTRASDGSLGVRMVGDNSESASSTTTTNLAGVTQHFHFSGDASGVSRDELKRAAQEGAQAGYQMMLNDLKQNGPARQMIARR